MLRLSFLTVAFGLLCCSQASAAESEDVQALIQAVSGQDQAAALQAMDDLADLGPKAEPAVAALTEVFSDESDETVRSRAARALGAIGEKAEAAVPALTAALEDESASIRAYAAFALGRIGKAAEPAAGTLAKNAFDKDALVRRASLNALRKIDPPHEVTRPVFLKILKEGDPSIIMPALQSFADEAKQDLARLKEALQDDQVCYWACIIAQDLGPDAAPAVPELCSLLDHKDPDVRMHAAIALAEIGEDAAPAVPLLVAKLKDDPLDAVKFASAFALGSINQKDDAATRVLVDAAKDGAPLVKVMSWWALATQNPDRSKVVEGAAIRIAEALTSEDANLRKVAAQALANFDVPHEIVRPILLKTLQNADPEVVANAMDAFASLGPDALKDIDDILAHPDARHFATLVIYRMGPKAAPAVPDLVEALQALGDTEDDNLFRREAQMALAAIGPDAAAAVPVLIESLASDDREVRGSACYALGKIGPAAAEAVPALQTRLGELEDSGQVAVVWALLNIKPDDEDIATTAVPILVGALDDPDEVVRAEAASAVGRIGEPAAKPEVIAELKKLLNDPAPPVQEAAAEALKELE